MLFPQLIVITLKPKEVIKIISVKDLVCIKHIERKHFPPTIRVNRYINLKRKLVRDCCNIMLINTPFN